MYHRSHRTIHGLGMRCGLGNLLFQKYIPWVTNVLMGKSLSLQHQLAISFGCCCDGAGLCPGSVLRKLNCLCPVSHTHIAASANSASWNSLLVGDIATWSRPSFVEQALPTRLRQDNALHERCDPPFIATLTPFALCSKVLTYSWVCRYRYYQMEIWDSY